MHDVTPPDVTPTHIEPQVGIETLSTVAKRLGRRVRHTARLAKGPQMARELAAAGGKQGPHTGAFSYSTGRKV